MTGAKKKRHVCCKVAEYNVTTGKIEFTIKDFVSEIQQVSGGGDAKFVIATAVGQPDSGKTKALDRLLQHWNEDPRAIADPVPDLCGIIVLLTTKPRVFKSKPVYLVCLDVVWDSEKFTGYRELLEACYQISNLVTFTFKGYHYQPPEPENMINLNTVKSGTWKAVAVLSDIYDSSLRNKYCAKLEEFVVRLDDFDLDVTQIRKDVLMLAGVGQDVPVQFEDKLRCDLIHSLNDDEFRKSFSDCTKLIEIFQDMGASFERQLDNSDLTASRPDHPAPAPPAPQQTDTYNDLQFAKAQLQVKASFRELAPKLIDSLLSSEDNFGNVFVSITKFGQTQVPLQPESLNEFDLLVQQLKQDLADCCSFSCSLECIVDKHFVRASCIKPDKLAELDRVLQSYLVTVLMNLKQETDFLTTLCAGVLAKYLSTLKAGNADIMRTEERLVKPASDAAFDAYTTLMDRKLAGILWSERDIRRMHHETASEVEYAFVSHDVFARDNAYFMSRFEPRDKEYFMSRFELELKPRMQSYVQKTVEHHAAELAKIRKAVFETFEVCRAEFDSLFNGKNEFGTFAELKREGHLGLAAALKKLEKVQEHLSPAGVKEVGRMLQNYCFDLMLNRTCEFPHAAEVLATKCHVTIIPGLIGDAPVKIIAEDLAEPVLMDGCFWLDNGNVIVMEAHLSSRYREMNNSALRFRLHFDNDYSPCQQTADLFEVNGTFKREKKMSVYFKALKKYLLEMYHIVPSKVTVVVSDLTSFIRKHQMDAAIRLSGLPPPKFMFHVGAVATGFYRKNPDLKFGGKTLFVVSSEGWAFAAKFQLLKSIVKVTGIKEESHCKSLEKAAESVLKHVKEDVNISSVVVIHNFSSQDRSWRNQHQLPDRVIMYHDQYVTTRELLDLAAEGADFFNTYSDAAYHEATLSGLQVVWDWGAFNGQICGTLVKENYVLRHDVFVVDTVSPGPCFWDYGLDSEDFYWRISIQHTGFPLMQFRLNVPESTKAVTYTLRLRKDGILCEPEFRDKSTKQLLQWEMTGGLMPWNHEDFKKIPEPAVELCKLADIEIAPLRLLKCISEGVKAMKLELKEVLEEQEKFLLFLETFAEVTAVEKIRSKLEKAKKMLEQDTSDSKVVEIEAMVKQIKCSIEMVKNTH